MPARKDEVAFEAVVRRHGQTVYGNQYATIKLFCPARRKTRLAFHLGKTGDMVAGREVEARSNPMSKFTAGLCSLLLCAFSRGVEEKEPKLGWEYVRSLVELRGQLHFPPDEQERGNGFVRVGGGLGLKTFQLDYSEAPQLREKAKKLDGKWVLVTGTLKPPGKEYVMLGHAGTVKAETLKMVASSPLIFRSRKNEKPK
jgi:hypothetical protein